MVHGIGTDEVVDRELPLPPRGIGIDADETGSRRGEARMVQQSEIVEPEFSGDIIQQRPKLTIAQTKSGSGFEMVDQAGVRHKSLQRGAAAGPFEDETP
jgi:hypothetical protein